MQWYDAIGRGMTQSVLTQGIGVITGLQRNFSWSAVAAAGAGSLAANYIEGIVPGAAVAGDPNSKPTWYHAAATGGASAIADAATHSLIDGSDFGDNVLAALPSVLGNVIGQMLTGQVSVNDEKDAGDGARAQLKEFLTSIGNAGVVAKDGTFITTSPEESKVWREVYDQMTDATLMDNGRAWSPKDASSFANEVAQLYMAKEVAQSEIAKMKASDPVKAQAAEKVLAMALLSTDAYMPRSIELLMPEGYSRLSSEQLATMGIKASDLRDGGSGFSAAIYGREDSYDLIIANRGTFTPEGWSTDFDQYLDIPTAQYGEALSLAERVVTFNQGRGGQTSVTGHSLGGGLAQIQAAKFGLSAMVFNSAALRVETFNRLEHANYKKDAFETALAAKTSAFSVEGDGLTVAQNSAPGIFALIDMEISHERYNTMKAGWDWKEPTVRDTLGSLSDLKPIADASKTVLDMQFTKAAALAKSAPDSPDHWTLPAVMLTRNISGEMPRWTKIEQFIASFTSHSMTAVVSSLALSFSTSNKVSASMPIIPRATSPTVAYNMMWGKKGN